MQELRCKKCNSKLIPTPESLYQELKCPVCKREYEHKYSSSGIGHGIG